MFVLNIIYKVAIVVEQPIDNDGDLLHCSMANSAREGCTGTVLVYSVLVLVFVWLLVVIEIVPRYVPRYVRSKG